MSVCSFLFRSTVVILSLGFLSAANGELISNGGFSSNSLDAGQSGYLGSGQETIENWDLDDIGYGFLVPDGTAATANVNSAVNGPDPWNAPLSLPSGSAVSFYGSSDVDSADGSGWFLAIDGTYSLPFGAGTLSISQTVDGLTPGLDYSLSFYQASAQVNEFAGATEGYWDVEFGTSSMDSDLMSHASMASVSGWDQQEMTFTATAASQVISFTAVGTPSGDFGLQLLSGVSLTEASAVPEPSSFICLAFVSCGLLGRRWASSRQVFAA